MVTHTCKDAWTDQKHCSNYGRCTEITVVPSNVALGLRHTLGQSSSVLGLATVLSLPLGTLPLN